MPWDGHAHDASKPRGDDTFFSDILTAAVDGGVSHWATTGHIERFEDCYVRVQIRDIEGEMDWQVWTLPLSWPASTGYARVDYLPRKASTSSSRPRSSRWPV